MSRDTQPPSLPDAGGTLSANYPITPPDSAMGQPPHANGRWCPYCGANLSHVPVREEPPEEAVFAAAGRRLKVALAVGFVVVWLGLSVYDWLSEPAALVVPAWFSALGALMLFYLLGFSPMGLLRRRG